MRGLDTALRTAGLANMYTGLIAQKKRLCERDAEPHLRAAPPPTNQRSRIVRVDALVHVRVKGATQTFFHFIFSQKRRKMAYLDIVRHVDATDSDRRGAYQVRKDFEALHAHTHTPVEDTRCALCGNTACGTAGR